MCIVFLAFKQHPNFPLLIAANRDEFHRRPSRPLHCWEISSDLFGGRDLEAGGSWFMASRQGRFATVTNIRQGKPQPGKLSRGDIPLGFVSSQCPASYLAQLREQSAEYAGFNLLAGAGDSIWYLNSQTNHLRQLEPGIYGLSNAQLDSSWPKVELGKQHLSRLLSRSAPPTAESLFALLNNKQQANHHQLPKTGLATEWEQLLSAIFIQHPEYGTRCSTLLLRDNHGRSTLIERNYSPSAEYLGQRQIRFG